MRYDNPPADRRPPKLEGKKFGEGGPQSSRERPRRTRPARPPRQDKPPRFRRLKEREAAVLGTGYSATSPPVPLPSVAASAAPSSAPASVSQSPTMSRAPGTPLTVPAEVAAAAPAHDQTWAASPPTCPTRTPQIKQMRSGRPPQRAATSMKGENERRGKEHWKLLMRQPLLLPQHPHPLRAL
uniref:Uncharacterized protein n=1 Tax=Cyprinodon variegatus TaxID=28743 RepID=A0A3Q2CCM8_CYPVA